MPRSVDHTVKNNISLYREMFFLIAYQGVSRKVWDTRSSAIPGYYGTTEFLENAGDPDIYEELTSFEAGPSGNFYVQELQSYFLATSSGDYNFYLTCAVECFLFIDDVDVGFWDKYGNINSKWSR
jgi:hypothetical protein